MNWPPQPGKPLPRASACWYEPIKFEAWILAPHGHGLEWRRIFQVGPKDQERVWQALASAANPSVIVEVRNHGRDGVTCGIRERLKIGTRSAKVTMSWHYADSNAAPRLVTAYPRP